MSDMSNRVLTGGRVIDPASKTDEIADVVIRDGMIEAVGQGLAAANPDLEVHDVSGYIVAPGLIDLHAHIAAGLGDFCLEADRVGVNAGVPTVIDGGTSGVATFGISRRYWDQPSIKTRVLAFLDPNQLYLATKDFICHKLEIANDLRNLDVDSALECVDENQDIIIGLKVRACYVLPGGPRTPRSPCRTSGARPPVAAGWVDQPSPRRSGPCCCPCPSPARLPGWCVARLPAAGAGSCAPASRERSRPPPRRLRPDRSSRHRARPWPAQHSASPGAAHADDAAEVERWNVGTFNVRSQRQRQRAAHQAETHDAQG